MQPEVYEVGDGDKLCRQAAELLMDHGRQTVMKNGRFLVALTGGMTVQPLYRYMADLEHQPEEESPWCDTFFFWGDERWVGPDHRDSNFGMARRLFLDPAAVAETNIFPVPTGLSDVVSGAVAYEKILREFFSDGPISDGFPVLDLVLLGMGTDGHVASIFPGTDALAENTKWVTDSFPPELQPAVDRVTLTLPVINKARMVIFLINGARKREIAEEVLIAPEKSALQYPAALVRPEGRVAWVIAKD